MVDKKTIETVLTKSIRIVKCHDYPKAVALKNFNESDFFTERYGDGVDTEVLPSPVGALQSIQADAQLNVDYTSIEKGVLHCYATDSYIPINSYLNGVEDWEEDPRISWKLYHFTGETTMPVLDESKEGTDESPWVDMTIPQQISVLDTIMGKNPTVQMDSLVYRYGELPLDIQVGDHGRFKGYISTSYNPFVAFKDIPEGGLWVQGEKNIRYKMRIFTPKGTRGVVLNRNNGCMDWQSELLLDRNQRYIVLNKNDVDMTADILIY